MFKKIRRWLRDPWWAFSNVMIEKYPNLMWDKWFLTTRFRQTFGRYIDWKSPSTFNEKLQWLKLYDRNPLYTKLVDKVDVKDWVADKIGTEYIIPTLGVYSSFEEIDFSKLPNQFVLKCSHDSGSVVICKDKATFDISQAKAILEHGLKTSFYRSFREWPYKNVKPRILAEEYLSFEEDYIMDYRIYCFNGKPQLIYAYTNYAPKDGSKPQPTNCDYFNIEWNPVAFHQHSLPRGNVTKPKDLAIILEKAAIIASNIPFARVDFYDSTVVRFGELTLFPGAGFSSFHPMEWDERLGEWLRLDMVRRIH